jgi:hypothetical protein
LVSLVGEIGSSRSWSGLGTRWCDVRGRRTSISLVRLSRIGRSQVDYVGLFVRGLAQGPVPRIARRAGTVVVGC